MPETPNRTEGRKRLLHLMFTTAIEGGIGYWSLTDGYHWFNDKTGTEDLDGFYATLESNEGDWGVENAYQPHMANCTMVYHGQPGWVEAGEQPLRLDIDVMERGVNLFIDKVIEATKSEDPSAPFSRNYFRQFVVQWLTDAEDGDSDADVADCIVQLGLFGEQVYA